MADKVMSPPKKPSGRSGVVQVKSSIINGPTVTPGNLQPHARNGKKGK